MKILIDINHPAHVHYFRNLIKIMEKEGHIFMVINRDSEIINQLLDYYQIEHNIRNKRPTKKGTIRAFLYLLGIICYCIKKSFDFKPDMYLGFGSAACAITSFLFQKPCVLLDDTEHNSLNHKLYLPFCSSVLTPFYFEKDFGRKQIKFNAYIEQLYLHSIFYAESSDVLHEIGVESKQYILVRYISYDAHHDTLVKPISEEIKKNVLIDLSKKYKVLLSVESGTVDNIYNDYILHISPEKMHTVIANAKYLITEGATMASEACVLGVPYLYANPLKVGNVDYQCKNYLSMAFQCANNRSFENEIFKRIDNAVDGEKHRKDIESNTINPTKFLIWFLSNYPKSKIIMSENPNYQYTFK